MSAQSRASVSELAAEFERAMASLADDPLPQATSETIARVIRFRVYDVSDALNSGADPRDVSDLFGRIAAIALEGAARLRRGT